MSLDGEDKQWILEQLERLETNLLTEFHKWASPLEARQLTHSAVRALDLEPPRRKRISYRRGVSGIDWNGVT